MTPNRTIPRWIPFVTALWLLATLVAPQALAPADAAVLPVEKMGPQLSEGTPFEEPENGGSGGEEDPDGPTDVDKPRTPDNPEPDPYITHHHDTLPFVAQRVFDLANWILARLR